MKLQQSESARFNLPSTGLSACILGFVLCPLAYIFIGALNGFSTIFSLITLPLLLSSMGYLLYRFVLNSAPRSSNKFLMLAEMISWFLIAAFLILISNFTLLSRFERTGLFFTLFFITTLLSFPLLLRRRTALEQRINRWPRLVIIFLLLILLLAAVITSAVYLLREFHLF